MPEMLVLNLPVADLARAEAFYTALGASKDPDFSDDSASGFSFSDTLHLMLLTHARFDGYSPRPRSDPSQTAQALFALKLGSRAEVDAFALRAAEAGGAADPTPPQEHGFMYGRSFADPDGHVWEAFWLDPRPPSSAADASTSTGA